MIDKMKIAQRWEAFSDWLNADVAFRRIDVGLVLIGFSLASYYYLAYGWQSMVLGLLFYLLVIMISVWML